MSAAALRECRAIAQRLPIQNIESAHADKDELVFTLGLLSDTWPNAATSSGRVADIPAGTIYPKQRAGYRAVPVVKKAPRRILFSLAA